MTRALLPIITGLAVALVGVLVPRTADACTSCQVGQEAPARPGASLRTDAERAGGVWLRLSGQGRSVGPAAARLHIDEQRATLGGSWAPGERVEVALALPILRRATEAANGELQSSVGPGDLLVGAEFVAWRGARGALRTTLAVQAPTSPDVRAGGQLLDDDAQLGSGAWIVLPGARYDGTSGLVRPHVRVAAVLPGRSRFGVVPGIGVLASAGAEVVATRWLSFRADADVRAEQADRHDGDVDPHSGGTVLFASPSAQLRASERSSVTLGVRVPVLDALRGAQHEGWIAHAGLAISLGRAQDAGATVRYAAR